jgi:hypothetical protein
MLTAPLKLRPSVLCILASFAVAHQLIAGVSVEQNSIGHTKIIISQDFKRIPEGLVNRNVFSNVLNVAVEDAILMALARAFHKVGAARENDRSPKVLRV